MKSLALLCTPILYSTGSSSTDSFLSLRILISGTPDTVLHDDTESDKKLKTRKRLNSHPAQTMSSDDNITPGGIGETNDAARTRSRSANSADDTRPSRRRRSLHAFGVRVNDSGAASSQIVWPWDED